MTGGLFRFSSFRQDTPRRSALRKLGRAFFIWSAGRRAPGPIPSPRAAGRGLGGDERPGASGRGRKLSRRGMVRRAEPPVNSERAYTDPVASL